MFTFEILDVSSEFHIDRIITHVCVWCPVKLLSDFGDISKSERLRHYIVLFCDASLT